MRSFVFGADARSGRLTRIGQTQAPFIPIAGASTAIGARDLQTVVHLAALQQTAASTEQLTTAVKQDAEGARDATKVSDKAVAIAQGGEEAISAVVRTMAQIEQQARDMGDILTVIDGLAFQTNLLALNAAFEAAHAGQQGRGFAVVANEVRAPAQCSAESAKEVRLLVEKSIAGAGQSASLVDAAKQTMGEIVQVFSSVTDIVTAIADASQERGRGIQQINYALAQMDEATMQNVALVEQASVATQSLGDQSGMLARSVDTFKTL
jgi:methyl-accepting chemotaxis protein